MGSLREGVGVCLSLAAASFLCALISGCFMDWGEAGNTPYASRVFLGSLFLFIAMAAGVYIFQAMAQGWLYKIGFSGFPFGPNILQKTQRVRQPLGFWGRILLFSACGLVLIWFAFCAYGGLLDSWF
jgi:hypothetical protein